MFACALECMHDRQPGKQNRPDSHFCRPVLL